jgi:hypothetical protein
LHPKGDLPEQLLSSDAINRLRASNDAKSIKEKFDKLIPDLLRQVSESTDVVSKALENLFSHPVEHNAEELERARLRKEHGNPPGKKSGPIGDQLNWEQILTRWRPDTGLWIITGDDDFAIKYNKDDKERFLNAFLYRELIQRYGTAPVFCFDNIGVGLADFVTKTGVKAEKLPTPEEIEKIRKQQESLPPMGWLEGYDDSAMVAFRAQQQQHDTMRRAALESQRASEDVIGPPPVRPDSQVA